ncbi:hypothetical protein [Aeromicrobium duanguangcaii]|uniref:hypothetical protein n=1 Tax=Aeromicrobium duanguangcaii TaxID=2968086 RepID=UPI002017477B|nr:hypothetical protein [Aeromicrobium duanguangcaii]MCL3837202.1 hypothetical protein [Aeromicrobium duanguangcaii]
MTGRSTRRDVAAPPARTRWAPVLAVMVVAPWFAELSWGGYPATDLPLIVLFLGPMYGGAAVLIREVARRTGRGWPTIVLFAAAFGVLQAGLVDQSLFNPRFGRYDFQHPVHIEGIDISLYYLVTFVTGHVVASIAIPIALTEAWSRRGAEPWLSRRGVWIVVALYAMATLVNFLGVKEEDGNGFQASPLQIGVAVAAVSLLGAAGLCWRRRSATDTRVPPPWVLAAAGFAAYLLYLPGENAVALAVGVLVITTAIMAIGTWSRSRRWTSEHTLALALGAVLVGVVVPFWADPYDDSVGASVELLADLGAAAISLTIVVATLLRRRTLRAEPD